MADTSWEESRNKRPHSRWLIWPLLVLVAASAAGIILYNNRDYIKGFSGQGSRPAPREVFSPEEVRGDQDAPGENRGSGAGSSRSKSGHAGGFGIRDSIVIPNIACRTMDRGDLLVRLSIVVYFNDAGRRSEITARREVMTVMVQKTLKAMALDDMKIDRIKPSLLRELNTVFETGVFNDISIQTIAVEKVSNE